MKFSVTIKLLLIFCLLTITLFSQEIPYSIEATRLHSYGDRANSMLYPKIYRWFQTSRSLNLTLADPELKSFKAEGEFEYENDVFLENVFLTPMIAEKTSGKIYFEVNVNYNDTNYTYQFTNFRHLANDIQGSVSFGIIPKYEKDFANVCTEDWRWCKLVYNDIKRQCFQNIQINLMKIHW